jgi:hypothetical protein
MIRDGFGGGPRSDIALFANSPTSIAEADAEKAAIVATMIHIIAAAYRRNVRPRARNI